LLILNLHDVFGENGRQPCTDGSSRPLQPVCFPPPLQRLCGLSEEIDIVPRAGLITGMLVQLTGSETLTIDIPLGICGLDSFL
jgi:hypothetical protein